MNYELLNQLKDAGMQLDIAVVKDYPAIEIDGEWYLPPLLEELIEACGGDFYALQNEGHSWEAKCYKVEHLPNNYSEGGATPSMAVAKLWLALNKKI